MTHSLWAHQQGLADHFHQEYLDGMQWSAGVLPTAGGKTSAVVIAARRLIEQQAVRLVIVAAPLCSIMDAFASGYAFLDHEGKTLQAASSDFLILTSEDTGDKPSAPTREAFEQALTKLKKKDRETRILVCSHSAIRSLLDYCNPKSLKGALLIIDESHHLARATRLGKVADDWCQRGGRIWEVTATAFRTDQQNIRPSWVVPYVVLYTTLMRQGLLPKNLHFNLREIQAERSDHQLLDTDYTTIAREVALLVWAGRQVILVIAPCRDPVGGGATARSASAFKTALIEAVDMDGTSIGLDPDRILHSVGDGDDMDEEGDEPATIRVCLDAERTAIKTGGWKARKYDVLISCKRLAEGSDIPGCSVVVSVGLSMALLVIVQALGRAARNKAQIAGFPQEWADRVDFIAYVPTLGKEKHTQRLACVACMLQCSAAASALQAIWVDLVSGSTFATRLPPIARTWSTGGEAKAKAQLVVEGIRAHLTLVMGSAPTVKIIRRFVRIYMDEDLEFDRHLVEILLAPTLSQEEQQALAEQILEQVANHPAPSREVFENELAKGLEALMPKYEHLLVTRSYLGLTSLEALLTPDVIEDMVSDVEGLYKGRVAVFESWQEAARVCQEYRRERGMVLTGLRGEESLGSYVGHQMRIKDADHAIRRMSKGRFGLDIFAIMVDRGWVTGKGGEGFQEAVKSIFAVVGSTVIQGIYSGPHWSSPRGFVAEAETNRYSKRWTGKKWAPLLVDGREENLIGLWAAQEYGWRSSECLNDEHTVGAAR